MNTNNDPNNSQGGTAPLDARACGVSRLFGAGIRTPHRAFAVSLSR
jgi:hypothetical protein